MSPCRLRRGDKRAAARRNSDQNNATEEAAEKGVDAKAESKVVSTDECSKEFDEYVFSYWNSRNQSN